MYDHVCTFVNPRPQINIAGNRCERPNASHLPSLIVSNEKEEAPAFFKTTSPGTKCPAGTLPAQDEAISSYGDRGYVSC